MFLSSLNCSKNNGLHARPVANRLTPGARACFIRRNSQRVLQLHSYAGNGHHAHFRVTRISKRHSLAYTGISNTMTSTDQGAKTGTRMPDETRKLSSDREYQDRLYAHS